MLRQLDPSRHPLNASDLTKYILQRGSHGSFDSTTQTIVLRRRMRIPHRRRRHSRILRQSFGNHAISVYSRRCACFVLQTTATTSQQSQVRHTAARESHPFHDSFQLERSPHYLRILGEGHELHDVSGGGVPRRIPQRSAVAVQSRHILET